MERGDLIRKRRLQLNLTQQEFADRVHISKSFISEIENNKKLPSMDSFDLILSTLEMTHTEFYRQLSYASDHSETYSVYRAELIDELNNFLPKITNKWSTEELMEILSYIKVKERMNE